MGSGGIIKIPIIEFDTAKNGGGRAELEVKEYDKLTFTVPEISYRYFTYMRCKAFLEDGTNKTLLELNYYNGGSYGTKTYEFDISGYYKIEFSATFNTTDPLVALRFTDIIIE